MIRGYASSMVVVVVPDRLHRAVRVLEYDTGTGLGWTGLDSHLLVLRSTVPPIILFVW